MNLRVSLRELSDQLESSEQSAVDEKTKELKEELTAAKGQLSELTTARERQEALMTNLVHQRDMYRTLLTQQSPKAEAPAEGSQNKINNLNQELEHSKKEMTTLKKEHEDYRSEKAKNDKILQKDYDNLRGTMDKTRNENIKLLSQAEYNNERIKTLQNNGDVLRRQIAALEKNNTTLNGIIGRHEGSIDTLRNEYLTLQKKISRAEIAVDNLREEKTLLKETEARLLAERESMSRGNTSQAMVLANLETIKINLERKDSEEKMRNDNRIAELTEQVSLLKAKLASNSDIVAAEEKVNELEARIKTMHEEYATTTKQLLEVRAELTSTKAKISDLQERAKVQPSPGARARGMSPVGSMPLRSAGPSPQVRDLEVQLAEEKAKVTALQTALDQSKRSVNELMELSKQHEKQLADSTEACKTANEEFNKLKKEADENENKLNKTETQLREAVEEGETLKSLLNAKLAKTAGEVQDKYEREVILHAADLTALATLKERQAEYNTELQEAVSAKGKAEEAVRETRLGFEERETTLRKENKELMVRSHELEEQNKSLLDQFTQLSDKMAAMQRKFTSTEGEGQKAPFTEDEARSSDQLREIIKYLRRERDVTSGKFDLSEAENQRIEAQRTALRNQVTN
ncbi:Nucleoprotein TPR [Chionoecetes opilio]|uniref:Nucleoprotein TPR n=1 Tax=Chionoecetes opilio TaxID=41210 RepID=A0A8J5CX61_CHIOP|nr:Nucleoprotein TPR [Chionoecetes opilio]